MGKSWKILLAGLVLFGLMTGTAMAEAPFHIGVVTLTVSQAEDTYRGAERLIKEYGDVAEGGYIKHITLPDNFRFFAILCGLLAPVLVAESW